MRSVIYAHQGGWDEILLVVGPIAVIVALLIVAQRRATRTAASSDADDPSAERTADGEPNAD